MIEMALGLGAMALAFAGVGVTTYKATIMRMENTQALPISEKPRPQDYPTHYTMPTGSVRSVDARLVPWNDTPVKKELNILYKCGHCQLYSRRHDQVTASLQMEVDERLPVDVDEIDDYRSSMYSTEWVHLRHTHNIHPGSKWFHERVCPHCDHANKLYISFDDEKYEWLNDHPDCLRLDHEGLQKICHLHEGLRNLIKENKSTAAFLEYNKLAKTVAEANQRHGITLEEAANAISSNSKLNKNDSWVDTAPDEIWINGNLHKWDGSKWVRSRGEEPEELKLIFMGEETLEIRAGGERFTLKQYPDGLHCLVDATWVKTTREEINQLVAQAKRRERAK